jgi:release factor glutamine methyltransferase
VNAELLSKFTLGCDRAYLHVRPEGELSCEEGERYDRALGERSRGIPAVYITGHQEFWGMDFIVNFRCPDSAPTEHVVETVLELTRTGGKARARQVCPHRRCRYRFGFDRAGASPRNCP